MSNKNYERGYALEAKLVKYLEKELKWPFVRRTPGSKSPCDVYGITPNGVATMFQCKSTIKNSFDLTDLFNSVSVFRLRLMPQGVEKFLLIKIGHRHYTEYHFYKWDVIRNAWMGNLDFKLKKERKENNLV